MLKYLLCPLPALLGFFARWFVLLIGEPRVERNEIHPRPVYHFADFCLLLGVILSAVWLCTCVVQDVFDWVDRRPLRKLLREEEKRQRTGEP